MPPKLIALVRAPISVDRSRENTGVARARRRPALQCRAFTFRFRRALFILLLRCDILFTGKASWLGPGVYRPNPITTIRIGLFGTLW